MSSSSSPLAEEVAGGDIELPTCVGAVSDEVLAGQIHTLGEIKRVAAPHSVSAHAFVSVGHRGALIEENEVRSLDGLAVRIAVALSRRRLRRGLCCDKGSPDSKARPRQAPTFDIDTIKQVIAYILSIDPSDPNGTNICESFGPNDEIKINGKVQLKEFKLRENWGYFPKPSTEEDE